MEQFIIRPIKPEDNAIIAQTIRATLKEFNINKPGTVFGDAAIDHLFEWFQQPRSIYYVAELTHQITKSSNHQIAEIAGGAGIFPLQNGDENICELQKMYLQIGARGKGIGKELMETCLAFARANNYAQCYIETMPELKTAIAMYEKFGFKYLQHSLGNTGHYDCKVWMIKNL